MDFLILMMDQTPEIVTGRRFSQVFRSEWDSEIAPDPFMIADSGIEQSPLRGDDPRVMDGDAVTLHEAFHVDVIGVLERHLTSVHETHLGLSLKRLSVGGNVIEIRLPMT